MTASTNPWKRGDYVQDIEVDGSAGIGVYKVLGTEGHATWLQWFRTSSSAATSFSTKGAHQIVAASEEAMCRFHEILDA